MLFYSPPRFGGVFYLRFCLTKNFFVFSFNQTKKSEFENFNSVLFLNKIRLKSLIIRRDEMKKFFAFGSILIILLVASSVLSSCGSDEQKSADFSKAKSTSVDLTGGLSEFELENGIGPVKQKLELGQIDPRLVKKGEEIFNTKCVACHKLDERYVGPAQRDVIKRRTPEFIMNMMLNPTEMQEKHPVVRQLLAEYMTQMTNQNLSFDDARAILEYFRELGK